MNFFKTYFSILLLLIQSCSREPENRSHRLVHHRVFVLADSVPAPVVLQNPDTSYVEQIFRMHGLVDVQSLDSSIQVDLRYAGTNNFLNRDLYDGLKKAYFPCEMAIRLCNAQHFLKRINPAYSLLILDAARPLHIQKMMWDSLDMHPDLKFNYLAPPHSISMHNYGCAVDLTIADRSTGKLLDMGSEYDDFKKLSQPVYEWQFLKSGELSQEAYKNRKLLRSVMKAAKLDPITSEWWHFNLATKSYAAEHFTLIQ